jgi:tRNA/tmRNA/rRNA uracil-C5-methylase (TrmA/RlmC/RlmD family)
LDPIVEVVRAPVETYLKRTPRLTGTTVIVDPPRAGLSREVRTRLARARPDRVVYVSCDVATQARDLRALGLQGYGVTRVQAFDMFPNTPHVETVVLLEHGGSPG